MPTTGTARASAHARFSGLDGLRAIAVILVLIYHFFPTVLPGGFLGVDVFFIISGFLITSLLLRERQRNGHVNLVDFWRRRARRLFPALVLVLLICTTAALIIGGDVLVGIGAQLLGSLFFVSNWVYIARGADYFAHDAPELYRNTWSLAIEEQFYLVLPLMLLLAFAVQTSRFWRAMPFAVLSIGSAALMAVMALEGGNATRIYFGSDTHTFGLFMGVTLALTVHEAQLTHWAGWVKQLVTLTATAAGLAVLVWLALTLREGSPESFAGGFQLASVAALLIVWAITRPGAWVGRALDVAPMRWIGERSYGIYLWHWPVLVLIAAVPTPWARTTDAMWMNGTLALLITLPLAILSYRFVEQPVRRLGLRGAVRTAIRSLRVPTGRKPVAVAFSALLVVTVPATVAAVIVAPERTTAAEAVARGQEALLASGADAAPSASSADSSASATPEPTPSPEPSPTPPPPPPPPAIVGEQIWAVGDSVMLASAGALHAALPGVAIDADVSRSFGFGVSMIEQQAAAGLRPVLVLGLGTNGPVTEPELAWLHAASAGSRIVLVNAHGDRWWIPEVNQALAGFAAAHRGIVVADWDSAIAQSPWALAGDGIHPGDEGAIVYAQVVQQALEALNGPDEWPL